MTNTLSIIIAAALVNNVLLIQFLGVSSLFYGTRRLESAVQFALFNFLVLFLCSLANAFLYRYLLAPLHLEFLRLLTFVAVSALFATWLLRQLERQLPLSARQQGLLIFLSGGNSAVLGTTLLNINASHAVVDSIAFSFGAALGYSLLIVGFAALRSRIQSADIPQPFQGSAIALVTAGLVAIGLLGFAGLT